MLRQRRQLHSGQGWRVLLGAAGCLWRLWGICCGGGRNGQVLLESLAPVGPVLLWNRGRLRYAGLHCFGACMCSCWLCAACSRRVTGALLCFMLSFSGARTRKYTGVCQGRGYCSLSGVLVVGLTQDAATEFAQDSVRGRALVVCSLPRGHWPRGQERERGVLSCTWAEARSSYGLYPRHCFVLSLGASSTGSLV